MSHDLDGPFWRIVRAVLLARGWMVALFVLAVAVAFLWLGNLAGRLIGIALLIGFVVIARGLLRRDPLQRSSP